MMRKPFRFFLPKDCQKHPEKKKEEMKNGPAVQKFIRVHRNNRQLQSYVSKVVFPSCLTPWLTHLGVPILIQIINTGDAAPVTIWVVHMTNIPGSISRIASNHSLKDTDCKIINSTRCLPSVLIC